MGLRSGPKEDDNQDRAGFLCSRPGGNRERRKQVKKAYLSRSSKKVLAYIQERIATKCGDNIANQVVKEISKLEPKLEETLQILDRLDCALPKDFPIDERWTIFANTITIILMHLDKDTAVGILQVTIDSIKDDENWPKI